MTKKLEAIESDPDRIYLQPECCADPYNGRQWCDSDMWEPCEDGVKTAQYIRADIATQLAEALEKILWLSPQIEGQETDVQHIARQALSRYHGEKNNG